VEQILDRLGVREQLMEALSDAVKDIAKESAKEIGGEKAKRLATSAVGHVIVGSVSSEVAQVIGGELAKAVAGTLVGPLTNILFRVVDDTKARINRLLSEPERTAVREAQRFLTLRPESQGDEELIEEKFASVSDAFDKAYTLAKDEKDATARMLWIRMMQGLIARRRGASAVARLYFAECVSLLKNDYSGLQAEKQAQEDRIAEMNVAVERAIKDKPEPARMYYPRGPMNSAGRELALGMNEDVASGRQDRENWRKYQAVIEHRRNSVKAERRKLAEIQNTENFIQVVRALAEA
jgi:hypothetical protein